VPPLYERKSFNRGNLSTGGGPPGEKRGLDVDIDIRFASAEDAVRDSDTDDDLAELLLVPRECGATVSGCR
jgi:hypothetical protein